MCVFVCVCVCVCVVGCVHVYMLVYMCMCMHTLFNSHLAHTQNIDSLLFNFSGDPFKSEGGFSSDPFASEDMFKDAFPPITTGLSVRCNLRSLW